MRRVTSVGARPRGAPRSSRAGGASQVGGRGPTTSAASIAGRGVADVIGAEATVSGAKATEAKAKGAVRHVSTRGVSHAAAGARAVSEEPAQAEGATPRDGALRA